MKRPHLHIVEPPKKRWWYISFSKGVALSGAVIVFALDHDDAATQAYRLGVRGDVAGFVIDEGIVPDKMLCNRLLTARQASQFSAAIRGGFRA